MNQHTATMMNGSESNSQTLIGMRALCVCTSADWYHENASFGYRHSCRMPPARDLRTLSLHCWNSYTVARFRPKLRTTWKCVAINDRSWLSNSIGLWVII